MYDCMYVCSMYVLKYACMHVCMTVLGEWMSEMYVCMTAVCKYIVYVCKSNIFSYSNSTFKFNYKKVLYIRVNITMSANYPNTVFTTAGSGSQRQQLLILVGKNWLAIFLIYRSVGF